MTKVYNKVEPSHAMHVPPDSITRANVFHARRAPGPRPSIQYIAGSTVIFRRRPRLCQLKGILKVGYSGLTESRGQESPPLPKPSLTTSANLTSSVHHSSVQGTMASV